MRSVGSELLSVATVLAIPIGIASVFPYAAVEFVASPPVVSANAKTASIVFLDETTVARVVRATRTVSRGAEAGRSYADLLPSELPGAGELPIAAIGLRRKPCEPPVIENGIPPFLPSRRASAPVRIPVAAERDEPMFSRNELLKLN